MRFFSFILLSFLLYPYDLILQHKDFYYTTPINIANINSTEDDFAPSFYPYESLIYFNSTISGFSQFYVTKLIDSVNFEAPKKINDELNEKYRNQSYITFASKDLAYLSAYRQSLERSYLNIFQTDYKKKSWIKSYLVESLASESFSAHPTLSSDGKILIFSSDRNNQKDTDLWMAFRDLNGSWGNIVNLTELNSSGNEITPFLYTDDSLFFASNGLGGKGGYDLFLSTKVDGVWQSPVPLTQFNTEWDESDLIVLPNHNFIFASNRPGGKGGLDLYFSRAIPIEKKETYAINDIDLSIATQITSINVIKNSKVTNVYFPNIVLLKKPLDDIKIRKSNDLNINSYINLLDNTFNILINRIINSQSKGISLTIINDEPKFQKIIREFLINTITKYTSIDSSNIKIDYSSSNEVPEYLIKLAEDRSYILIKYYLFNELTDNNIIINNSEYLIEPPVIELFFDSRPRTATEKINYSIALNEKIIFKSDAIKSLPEEKLFDLSSYLNQIWDYDSIVIHLEAYDRNNLYKNKKLVININKIEKGKLNSIEIKNKTYDVYDIFLSSLEDVNTISFVNYLKLFKSSKTYFSDSINFIISYPETNKNSQFIEQIVNILKITYQNKATVDIVSNKEYNFDDEFLKNFYRILVKNR